MKNALYCFIDTKWVRSSKQLQWMWNHALQTICVTVGVAEDY